MVWLRVGVTGAAPVLLTGLVLLVAACGGGSDSGNGDSDGSQSAGTITVEGFPANDHGTKEVSGGTVQVEMGEYYFEPTILVGAPGAKVKLEFGNQGGLEHNVTADIPQVDAVVPIDQDVRSGGGKASVEVTFPKSGNLLYICKYHEGDGMVGVLRAKP